MTFLRLALFVVFAAIGEYLSVHAAGQFASESFAFEALNNINRDRYAQGEQAALEAARLNTLNGYAQYHVASSQYLLDRYSEAVKQATRALPVMPHRASVYRLRGECLFELHKYAEAAADLLTFLTLTPQPPSNAGHLMNLAAECLLAVGRPGEAVFWLNCASSNRAALTKSLDLKTQAAMALKDPQMLANALSSLFAHGGEFRFNGSELLKHALESNSLPTLVSALELASETRPERTELTKTLATAYVRAASPKGLAFLQAAIARDDNNPDLHFMLGDLYFRLKNFAEAEAQFNRVLALQPDSQYRVEIERRKADMH